MQRMTGSRFFSQGREASLARENAIDLQALQHESIFLQDGTALRDDVASDVCPRENRNHRVFETDQLASIFEFVRAASA